MKRYDVELYEYAQIGSWPYPLKECKDGGWVLHDDVKAKVKELYKRMLVVADNGDYYLNGLAHIDDVENAMIGLELLTKKEVDEIENGQF
jgi:hypothetical protein